MAETGSAATRARRFAVRGRVALACVALVAFVTAALPADARHTRLRPVGAQRGRPVAAVSPEGVWHVAATPDESPAEAVPAAARKAGNVPLYSQTALALDDGTAESSVSVYSSDGSDALRAVYLNYFPPDPNRPLFNLESIEFYLGAPLSIIDVPVTYRYLIYASSSGDPSTATLYRSGGFVVQDSDQLLDLRRIEVVVGTPIGVRPDLHYWIGFTDVDTSFFRVPQRPVALDTTSVSGRSYVFFIPDADFTEVDDLSQAVVAAAADESGTLGNFLIRAAGTVVGETGLVQCTIPSSDDNFGPNPSPFPGPVSDTLDCTDPLFMAPAPFVQGAACTADSQAGGRPYEVYEVNAAGGELSVRLVADSPTQVAVYQVGGLPVASFIPSGCGGTFFQADDDGSFDVEVLGAAAAQCVAGPNRSCRGYVSEMTITVPGGYVYIVVSSVEPLQGSAAFTLTATQSGQKKGARKVTTASQSGTIRAILTPFTLGAVPLDRSALPENCATTDGPVVVVGERAYSVTLINLVTSGCPDETCPGSSSGCIRRLDRPISYCSGSGILGKAPGAASGTRAEQRVAASARRVGPAPVERESWAADAASAAASARPSICLPDWTPTLDGSVDVGVSTAFDADVVRQGIPVTLDVGIRKIQPLPGVTHDAEALDVEVEISIPPQFRVLSIAAVPGMVARVRGNTLLFRFERLGAADLLVPVELELRAQGTAQEIYSVVATIASQQQDVRTGNNHAGAAIQAAP